MRENQLQRLHDAVTQELAKGVVIDVYQLAEAWMPLCPNLTHQDIVQLISSDVAKGHGNAVWDDPRASTRH